MKIVLILIFMFLLTGFTYQEYYDYSKAFFWRNNDRCTIGDDDIFASKMATELYVKQVDLNKLKKEMKDSDINLKAINQVSYTKELREWFVVNEKKGYGCQEMGDNFQATSICQPYEIQDVNLYIKAYQLDNLTKLDKKWKSKPMPKYLEEAYKKNKLIIVYKQSK